MLLKEVLRDYVETNQKITSEKTVYLYGLVVRRFSEYLECDALGGDVTDKSIVGFERWRKKQAKSITAENEASKLRVIGDHAHKLGLCPALTVCITKTRPDSPHALFKHEIRAVCRAAEKSKDVVGEKVGLAIPVSIYFPAMLGLIWDSAERISPVHAINFSLQVDLHWRTRSVLLVDRKQRGGKVWKRLSWGTLFACRRLQRCVDDLNKAKTLELQRELGRPPKSSELKELGLPITSPFATVSLTTTYYYLDKLLVAANIPVERHNKFHALRRSHASYLKVAGGDAPASLGHNSEETTRLSYYDPRIVNRRGPADLLFSPFSIWHNVASLFRLLSE